MFGSGGCQRSKAAPLASQGGGRLREGDELASFLRFWAVAANRNSSLAPLGPRRRYRSRLRIRFQMSEEHLELLPLRRETV